MLLLFQITHSLIKLKKNFNGKLFKSNLWVNLPKISITKSKLKKDLKIPS